MAAASATAAVVAPDIGAAADEIAAKNVAFRRRRRQRVNEAAQEAQLRTRLAGESARFRKYLDPDLQDRARSVIPVERLHNEAEEAIATAAAATTALGGSSDEALAGVTFQDALLGALAKWYRDEFMQWVNSPPCSFCNPLMYEAGWKKKLTYVFAFGEYDVKDVIFRYSRALPAVYRRRLLVREGFVESLAAELTAALRDGLSPTARKELEERDIAEELERRSPPVRALRVGELVGRRSGGEEWRTARQESRGVHLKKTNLLFDLAGSEMSLVGSSASNFSDSRRTVVLTENRADQVGAAWTPARLPVDRSFVADFVFLIDRKGADGLAFVVQGAPAGTAAVGTGGAGLGYAGLPRSLAVEFDTYQGRDTAGDPSDNHVAVMSRGAAPNSPHHRFALACCTRAPPLHGRPLAARVVYRAAQRSLAVWLAEVTGEAADDPLKDEDYACLLEAEGVDLAEVVQAPDAFLGFTAATGGISQAHSILFFTVHLAVE
ncbi:peptide-N4-(N-acetyl-beta- glucosaminyl)asparagine amidase [Cladochytrium tenue]|nr:peptide-N4-(N-acetyl-beta- glucosaminyl)asparagine amidase [Cladochytrium tenue]